MRILYFSFVGGTESVTKSHYNSSPGLIIGAFCTIFRAWPVERGLGAKFGIGQHLRSHLRARTLRAQGQLGSCCPRRSHPTVPYSCDHVDQFGTNCHRRLRGSKYTQTYWWGDCCHADPGSWVEGATFKLCGRPPPKIPDVSGKRPPAEVWIHMCSRRMHRRVLKNDLRSSRALRTITASPWVIRSKGFAAFSFILHVHMGCTHTTTSIHIGGHGV